MRAFLRWALVVLVILAAVPALAGKVGFLDAERAVASVGEGKRQLKALEEWAQPRQERLQEMRTNLVNLNNQLEQLLRARRELEDAGRNFNRDLESKQNEFLEDVATKIGTVASDYGEGHRHRDPALRRALPRQLTRPVYSRRRWVGGTGLSRSGSF